MLRKAVPRRRLPRVVAGVAGDQAVPRSRRLCVSSSPAPVYSKTLALANPEQTPQWRQIGRRSQTSSCVAPAMSAGRLQSAPAACSPRSSCRRDWSSPRTSAPPRKNVEGEGEVDWVLQTNCPAYPRTCSQVARQTMLAVKHYWEPNSIYADVGGSLVADVRIAEHTPWPLAERGCPRRTGQRKREVPDGESIARMQKEAAPGLAWFGEAQKKRCGGCINFQRFRQRSGLARPKESKSGRMFNGCTTVCLFTRPACSRESFQTCCRCFPGTLRIAATPHASMRGAGMCCRAARRIERFVPNEWAMAAQLLARLSRASRFLLKRAAADAVT